MKIKTRTLLQITACIGIVCIALYFRQTDNDTEKLIMERGRYTIGETTGSSSNWLRSSTKGLHYKYSVGGVDYSVVRQFEDLNGVKTLEGLYIVRFLPEDPSKSLLLIDTPIVFKTNVPSAGWSKIPNYVIRLKR